MRALIRKDLDWLVIFFLLGMVLPYVAVFNQVTFSNVWIRPATYHFELLHIIWAFNGLIFGVFAALRDELTRTEEFLKHRPLSMGLIYSSRLIGCLGVIVAWLLAFLAFLALPGFWRDNAPLADWNRLGIYAILGAPAFSGFAIGFYAGSLRLFWMKRILLGVAGFLSTLYVSYQLVSFTSDGGISPFLVYIIIHLSIACLVVWASFVNVTRTHDPDRPLQMTTLLCSGTTAVLFTAVFAGALINGKQSNKYEKGFVEKSPVIIKMNDGEVRLSHGNWYESYRERKIILVNEKNEPLEEIPLPFRRDGNPAWPRSWSLRDCVKSTSTYVPSVSPGRETREFGRSWVPLFLIRSGNSMYLKRDEGLVYLYRLSLPDRPTTPTLRILGKGRENAPFKELVSAQSHLLPVSMVMVGDLADGTIWSCDVDDRDPLFGRIHLPDDDSFTGWEYISRGNIVFDMKMVVPYETLEPYFLALGRKGAYLWNGSEFIEAGEEFRSYIRSMREPGFRVASVDPLNIAVELVDEKGNVSFTHRYLPYTDEQKTLAVELYVYSLFRIPVFQWISFSAIGDPLISFRNIFFIDPLLATGKRFWLLAGNLAIAALLAFWAVRRLNRLGADRGRKIYWGILTVLGGLPVFIVYRLLVTKRAYRVSEIVREEDAPPMRIRTKIDVAAAAPQSKTT